MNPTEAQKREVKKYVDKWRSILFLNVWYFDIYYTEDEEEIAVSIKADHIYKNAAIYVNTKVFFERKKEVREEAIIHELCHCILEPFNWAHKEIQMNDRNIPEKEFESILESVTQHIARVIYYKEDKI